MVAMSVTAVSFGRMAATYPSSGSVYTYISRGLNPFLGFIVGWAMFLEYLFQPIQNALYAVLAVQRIMPRIPFAVIAALAVGLITLMTVQGIKFTARTDEVLLGFMVLVTAVFLVAAFRYIVLREAMQDSYQCNRSTIQRRSICVRWPRERRSRRWFSSDLMASQFWRRK
jgi:amino acid transporter